MPMPSPKPAVGDRRRGGFTFVELLIAISVAGILMAIVFPKLAPMRERGAVRSSKQLLESYLATARQTAIRRSAHATFHIEGNVAWVSVDNGTKLVEPKADLSSQHGLVVSSPITSVTFNPRGLSRLNGEQRIHLTRGALSDSVCISLLGTVGRCGL